jgi:predicted PurR-regulated permease PerM
MVGARNASAAPAKPTLSAVLPPLGRRRRSQGRGLALRCPAAMTPLEPEPPPDPPNAAVLPPSAALALKLLLAMLIVAALWFGEQILLPFALAALLSFILDPLVRRFVRWGLPRVAAVVLVVMGVVAVFGAISFFVANQLMVLSRDLPSYENTIRDKFRVVGKYIATPGALDEATRVFAAVGDEVEAARQEAQDNNPADEEPPRSVPRVQVEPTAPQGMDAVRAFVAPVVSPLTTAAIVLVFVIFILLEGSGLRDRLLRLVRGDLHRMTDAMNDAAERVSRYLTMQLAVNVGTGVVIGASLWLVGVPGALLWGVLSAVMHFVPYAGPVIAAVFPLGMAFAVDPGWSMVLWTLGVIVVLELFINNVIEPVVYGKTSGIAPFAVLLAASFWTLLWGPVGLILSTPLTLCLVVIGRHLPQLRFLDVLLGTDEVFDAPTRLYQRLVAGDPEGASEIAIEEAQAHTLQGFYNDTAVPALVIAAQNHVSASSVTHRHRVSSGMTALLADLRDEYHPKGGEAAPQPKVLAIGARWEIDTLAAEMLAHALTLEGIGTSHLPPSTIAAGRIRGIALTGVKLVVLSAFSPTPEAHARYVCRRLRRLRPDLRIVLALWQGPPALLELTAADALGADAVANSLTEVVLRVQSLLSPSMAPAMPAPIPADEEERLRVLHASGALDVSMRPAFDRAAQHVADVFDARMAMVSLIDRSCQMWAGVSGLPSRAAASDAVDPRESPRETSLCGHVVALHETMVVPDIHRDPRFAGNEALRSAGIRFYAGVPLRLEKRVIGALAIMDTEPRVLSERERELLESMADGVMAILREPRDAHAEEELSTRSTSAMADETR